MNNRVRKFRFKNFMGFQETRWIELQPIVLLFGRNSTGKSAILKALLLLQQSIHNQPEYGPFLLASEEGIDVGEFQNLVYNHDVSRNISFSFEIETNKDLFFDDDIPSPWFHLTIDYGVSPDSPNIIIKSLEVSALVIKQNTQSQETEEIVLFRALRNENSESKRIWNFSSDYYEEDDFKYPDVVSLKLDGGFIPIIHIDGSIDVRSAFAMGKAFNIADLSLTEAKEALSEFFSSLRYIGPIRSEPQRYYYVPQLSEAGVGTRGESAVRSFLSAKPGEKKWLEQINAWLRSTRINSELIVEPISSKQPLYMVNLKEVKDNQRKSASEEIEPTELSVSIKDVGFGVSQVLPVLIESLLAPHGSTVLIEQPELHLHPAAQAELGDIFLKAVEFGTRFIIETHSENLLYRLRRRMAEAALARKNNIEPELLFEPDHLVAYFVDRTLGVSTCDEIKYDEWGKYDHQPEGFVDFFGNDFEELIALDDARMRAE